jgi:hemoglobin
MLSLIAFAVATATASVPPGEQPVAPYTQSDANAGATPLPGTATWKAFHEQPGVDRIVDRMVELSVADPRISEIFKGQDLLRLRRLLKEQLCYILGGRCPYSGRTMAESHKDLGIQTKDMNALVENLQKAMAAEHVPFFAQNRLLAKLAPMKPDVVQR